MAKKNKKKQQNAKKFITYVAVILVIAIIVLAVFYVSNGYKFDFGFLEKDKESTSIDYSNIDEVRDLKITFIDIGQGDSILIELPDGRNMLIDAGEKRNENKAVLDKYLTDDKGNKLKLDYCIATHPDSDHIGLMPYVYEQYEVEKSYRPYVYSENAAASALPSGFNDGIKLKLATNIYYDYISGVYNEQTPWEFFYDDSDFAVNFKDKNGNDYSYSFNFMMPYAKTLNGYGDFTKKNDFSAIVMLEYAGKKVLFTGDIEYKPNGKSAEGYFVKEYSSYSALVDCDVLKVAHHGSDTSTSASFLSLVKPEYSVISCGLKNKYNHPISSTINNLINAKTEIYRTDLQGTVTLTISSDGTMNFGVQTHEFDDMLFDDGPTVELYEETYGDKIDKFKKSLGK